MSRRHKNVDISLVDKFEQSVVLENDVKGN